MNVLVKGLCLATMVSVSTPCFAYTQACQLVQKMAGVDNYQLQPNRIATMNPPDSLPAGVNLPLLERHGSWFVYQTAQPWYSKTECAPLMKHDKQWMPVLLNRQTGHNAVLTGSFLLKVYRAADLDKVIQRYHLKRITYLPKAGSAIVDVLPIDSYDELILQLDIDKDVQLLAPIMSEPN